MVLLIHGDGRTFEVSISLKYDAAMGNSKLASIGNER